jgi:hypothetical protein
MERVKVQKANKMRESSLLIALQAVRVLREFNHHEEADEVGKRINGSMPVSEAYKITSKYIEWVEKVNVY